MQAPVTPPRQFTKLWHVVDVVVVMAAVAVVLIWSRQAFVVMPWSIANAFALDNPAPDVLSAFSRFGRVSAMGISAGLFLLGYGLIRKMMSPPISIAPFVVVSMMMMVLIFSSVATWRVSPALSWTRPDAAEVSRQLWSAYSWSQAQSRSLPSWAQAGTHRWRLPGGLVAHVATRGNMARVSVSVSAGKSCRYLIDELSAQTLPAGAELRVGSRRLDPRGYGDACQGDKMKEVLLVSQKWPEQS